MEHVDDYILGRNGIDISPLHQEKLNKLKVLYILLIYYKLIPYLMNNIVTCILIQKNGYNVDIYTCYMKKTYLRGDVHMILKHEHNMHGI